MNGMWNGGARAGAGGVALWAAFSVLGCQGSTAGTAPPPASATAATAPESPAAGPPQNTAEAPANSAWNSPSAAPSAPSAAPSGSGEDPTRDVAGTSTVAQIVAMTTGTKATVRGLFLGWHGPCQGTPPTRSAWQIADGDQKGAACLYVDGPPPPGLDPASRGAPAWVRLDAELVAAGPSRFLTGKNAKREP